jgi:hypothetical protein
MFDKRDAYPCFPNVAPPPVILEFKLKAAGSHAGDEDGYGGQEVEADEGGEEEYDEEE